MIRGFTLLEVVVALLLLEVAVVGAAGTLLVASSTLQRAERMERASTAAEGVLDSLRSASRLESGARVHDDGRIRWLVDEEGAVSLWVVSGVGDSLLELRTLVAPGW